jgi:hypothetical protein
MYVSLTLGINAVIVIAQWGIFDFIEIEPVVEEGLQPSQRAVLAK